MIKVLKRIVKRMFCRHKYVRTWQSIATKTINKEKYITLGLRCEKCGKTKDINYYDNSKWDKE